MAGASLVLEIRCKSTAFCAKKRRQVVAYLSLCCRLVKKLVSLEIFTVRFLSTTHPNSSESLAHNCFLEWFTQ